MVTTYASIVLSDRSANDEFDDIWTVLNPIPKKGDARNSKWLQYPGKSVGSHALNIRGVCLEPMLLTNYSDCNRLSTDISNAIPITVERIIRLSRC